MTPEDESVELAGKALLELLNKHIQAFREDIDGKPVEAWARELTDNEELVGLVAEYLDTAKIVVEVTW